MIRDPSEFSGAPWQSLAGSIPRRACAVPTMLRDEEQALYYWLARHWARGDGAVVDLGCFVGGSTARIAAGAEEAGHGAEIHAYDRFTANERTKERTLYPQGVLPFEGRDVLPLTRQLLLPWAESVRLHAGDIGEACWQSGPVEMLIVDAAKTSRSADAIAGTFFPALLPGGSVIVQQDFLHWRQPWLIAQMQLLSAVTQPVAFCARDCAVFLVTEAIGATALDAARTDHLTDAQLIELLEAAAGNLAFAPIKRRVGMAIASVRANPGERRAWAFEKEAPAS